MCINQTVPEPGQKNMKFIFYLCRTTSASMLFLTNTWQSCLCSDPVTWTTPSSNLCNTCHSRALEGPTCFWLSWEWWQSLSLSHHCCSHQCSAVALPLLRRKNLLLTHILFWSRKLFLDATGLTHQPEFKSPTTGFSSFCFIASVLFLQNKRRSFWAHAENKLSMSLPSVLSTRSAETLFCAYLLLEFREDVIF